MTYKGKLIGSTKAGRILGISARTIQRWVKWGWVVPVKLTPKGQARFWEKDVRKWLDLDGVFPGLSRETTAYGMPSGTTLIVDGQAVKRLTPEILTKLSKGSVPGLSRGRRRPGLLEMLE